jgi:hypothetical protein
MQHIVLPEALLYLDREDEELKSQFEDGDQDDSAVAE